MGGRACQAEGKQAQISGRVPASHAGGTVLLWQEQRIGGRAEGDKVREVTRCAGEGCGARWAFNLRGAVG